jgi:hypothetical protein
MGIFFSQQNNNIKKDKIHIEPIHENNLQPVNHSDLQPVYQSISQPILPPLELQSEKHDEINPVINENLKKEIHSKHLLRVINEDKYNDQENFCEDQIKNTNYKNKRKRKRKKKEEND